MIHGPVGQRGAVERKSWWHFGRRGGAEEEFDDGNDESKGKEVEQDGEQIEDNVERYLQRVEPEIAEYTNDGIMLVQFWVITICGLAKAGLGLYSSLSGRSCRERR